MNKKETEKFKIGIIKSQIETEKITMDRYVNTIVRSAFIENCTGGHYFNELFHTLLLSGYDTLEKSKASKKVKEEAKKEWFPLFAYRGNTEIERWQENLKYQKRLTNWAKYLLESLDNKKKEEIIRDCITQQEMWSSQFDKNSKLYKKLKGKNE